jgi:hypothetical protein
MNDIRTVRATARAAAAEGQHDGEEAHALVLHEPGAPDDQRAEPLVTAE